MLKFNSFSAGRRRVRSWAGWTLVEMMMAVAASAIILTAFVATTITISKTMLAVGNYTDLDRSSRNTLDLLSHDVRNAADVSTASTATAMTLTNTYNGTNTISYAWDGTNVTRTGSVSGDTTILLKNCDTFALAYYQRNPTNSFAFVPTTTPDQTKLVSVSWHCSRTILGSALNTESVQTAKVVMRN